MERYSDRAIEILNELHTERLDYHSEYLPLIDAAQRLSAYENTGMEPEEIERVLDAYGRGLTLRSDIAQKIELVKDIPVDRLRELAQADKDGRCVVLPCKVGDTIYQIGTDREIVEYNVGTISITKYGISFAFWVDGFGAYRTSPDEKVYFDRESAKSALNSLKGEQT